MKSIYLDYAAATPLSDECLSCMLPYMQKRFYNPSAGYLAARSVKKDLEMARGRVAQLIGARPAEITFVSGATEANNLAISGIMTQYPDGEVVASAIEHDSVLEPAKRFNYKLCRVNGGGVIDTTDLQKKISEKTVLISTMYVNNELGTIQPLREINKMLRQIRIERKKNGNTLPILLHSDAVQAANYLDLHVSNLGVDLLTLNGGKIYGPKQSGILFKKTGIKIEALIFGGGQEVGIRSGTENVAGCIGFSMALQNSQQERKKNAEEIQELRQYFTSELQNHFSSVYLNGYAKHLAPHIVSVTFGGIDNEQLMMQLDEADILVAVGSACSASSSEPSHVLSAIGLNEKDARSTIRFSFGKDSSKADIDSLIFVLKKLIKQ